MLVEPTSLTDTRAYRDFCARAAADPDVYATFREAPEYRDILAVTPEQGGQYRALLNYDPGTDDPVMLRYHVQAQEIRRLFAPLGDVVEIGGGFGGLASLLAPECSRYEIVDLPEVRALQNVYLERFGISTTPIAGGIDVLISCYAFSELAPLVQHEYRNAYLSRARRGYMVCNFIRSDVTPELLEAMVPRSRWLPEHPLTHPDNRVLVWDG